MKNKQTLFGHEEKRKNDASMFFHANQTVYYKAHTVCFLIDTFKNSLLHKTIEATIKKIEQNLRNKQIYIQL